MTFPKIKEYCREKHGLEFQVKYFYYQREKSCNINKGSEKVFKKTNIREYLFQVVDMRWGVRDEMTNEHMTTALCMTELRNCQRLSMGPNFIYFGAQKYGYRLAMSEIK